MTNDREPIDALEEARHQVAIANDEIVAARDLFERYPSEATRAALSIAQLKLDEAIHGVAEASNRIRSR